MIWCPRLRMLSIQIPEKVPALSRLGPLLEQLCPVYVTLKKSRVDKKWSWCWPVLRDGHNFCPEAVLTSINGEQKFGGRIIWTSALFHILWTLFFFQSWSFERNYSYYIAVPPFFFKYLWNLMLSKSMECHLISHLISRHFISIFKQFQLFSTIFGLSERMTSLKWTEMTKI